MKGNKGITLIALVITIIVLLILAAVSIAMLTGDNSILKRSTQAAAANALGAAKDELNLDATEALEEYFVGIYASNTATTEASTYSQLELDKKVVGTLNKKSGANLDTKDVSLKSITAPTTAGTEVEIELTYTPDSSTVKGKLKNGKINWEAIQFKGQQ